jgi:hypothetical protein
MEHEGRGRCVSFEMMHMMTKDMTHERRDDFLEGVERLCVCMCVCVFEDEADFEYEQGVEFATQSVQSANFVHVLSSNAPIRNCAEFGQEMRTFDRHY